MNSLQLTLLSAGCLLTSIMCKPLAVPSLTIGTVAGFCAQKQWEYEQEYEIPIRRLRQAAAINWQEEVIGYESFESSYQLELEHNSRISEHELLMALNGSVSLPPALPTKSAEATNPGLPASSEYQELELDIDFTNPEKVADAVLPVHDLWQELEASNRHIWLVATTQSGKTWAEYAILTHGFDRTGGMAQAIISDIKGSAFKGECGIADYYFSDQVDDMPRHADQIEKAVKILSARRHERVRRGGTWDKKPAPLYLVIPELNSYVQKAREWDVLNPPPKPGGDEEPRLRLAQRIGLLLLEIITQGLEDNVRLIVDAQTSRIEEFNFGNGVKFTGGTRNNLSMAALSRCGDYIGIRDFLKFNCQGMPGDPESTLLAYDQQQQDKMVPIAATNMGGALRLVQTPAIDLKKIKREWKPIAVTVKPKPVVEEKAQLESNFNESSENIIDVLKRWQKQTGRHPSDISDEELVQMFCRFTEIDLDKIPDPQATADKLRKDLGWAR